MILSPSPPLVLLWIIQIKDYLTFVMITVNPPVNHSSKLIFFTMFVFVANPGLFSGL